MNTGTEFDLAFQSILEDVLGWGVEFREEDGPGTIEAWNSLAQIRLVHALEMRFEVRLPDSALLEPQTVGSLKQIVRELASVVWPEGSRIRP